MKTWKLAVGIAVLAIFVLAGCSPKTVSPTTGEDVTRVELAREIAEHQAEAEAYIAKVSLAHEDLAAKEEFRTTIINTLGSLGNAAAAGTVTPAAGINAAVLLLLGGMAGRGVVKGKRLTKENAALKGK